MIYKIRDGLMERINYFDMETWAVVKANPERIKYLVRSAQMIPEVDFSVINDHVLIKLKEGFGSISKKMQILISILLSSKPASAEKNFLHLALARFSILEGKVSKAGKELNEVKSNQNINDDQEVSYTPFIFKVLDKFFFESQDLPEKIFQDLYIHHLASLFFQTGNDLYGKKNFIEAKRVYHTAVELDDDLSIPVAKRYESMGHFFLTQGKGKKAVKAYKDALKLDSSLLFLNFSLAESYLKSGQMMEAEKTLCQGLGIDKLPEVVSRWINTEKPFVLVWKEESKWNLIVHSKKRASYSGRIIDIEDLDDLESFQFRKKDTLSAENGEIKFVLERSKRKFRGFQFRSEDQALDLEFYINGDTAQDKIIFLDSEGSDIQLKN
jgi:tetratricopeptide (TPR) repeat protein